MNTQEMPLTQWQTQLTTMNLQQAVEALNYWVEQLEKHRYSIEYQTQILELIVNITRRCHVLSHNEST